MTVKELIFHLKQLKQPQAELFIPLDMEGNCFGTVSEIGLAEGGVILYADGQVKALSLFREKKNQFDTQRMCIEGD